MLSSTVTLKWETVYNQNLFEIWRDKKDVGPSSQNYIKHIEYNGTTQRTASCAYACVGKIIPGRGCMNWKRVYVFQ